MREGKSWAPLLMVGLAASGCLPNANEEGQIRHVIFVSLDTTRADQLGLYGNVQVRTPHLDRLAAESIVLDDFVTVVPTTLSSHTSLFTGKYPHSHGVPGNGFVVPMENRTLAEILKDRGFTTAAFVSSFALDARFALSQGFDFYDDAMDRYTGRDDVMQNERIAASTTDAVLAWLRRVELPERLFLFVHYFDAHVPYAPPPPYDTIYDPRGRHGLPGWSVVTKECSRAPGSASEDGTRMALQYAGELSYLDEHIGRLLESLREAGILEDALLVVTSDHGENFWEHVGCFDHGWNTYQATMRIAGIVRLPRGLGAGARVSAPLANIDILPAVLQRLGIPIPLDVEGAPFDLETGAGPLADRARFGQATKPWSDELQRDSRWLNSEKTRCVRRGDYKLVFTPWANVFELYDVKADPHEQENLLSSSNRNREIDRIARELRPLLDDWAASAKGPQAQFEMSQEQETILRLKSLGYLGGN